MHKASSSVQKERKRERKEGGVFGRARWGGRGEGGREREGRAGRERARARGDLKRDVVGPSELTNNPNKDIELVRPFA